MGSRVVQPFRRMAPWTALIGGILLMFLLAACGGGGTDSATTPQNSSNSNTSSSSSSNSGSMSSIMIMEKQGASGGDVYTFDPTTITVHKGDMVTIQNHSDESQALNGGDASKAGVNANIPVNQSAMVTFNTVGTFVLKTAKGATITVTVQ